MNKGTVDTQQRRFQLSRTPNNTFPLTISGRATQVGIASFSGARVSEGEPWGHGREKKKNIHANFVALFLSLFLLITVDWHFSLCCSSMLILFFLFLLSPRICWTPPANLSSWLQSLPKLLLPPPLLPSMQQKQFSNEAQVQKIDWLNICVDAVDIDKVHSACPINLPVSHPRHRQQSMRAFNKIK